jgi:thymidylate synthase ThyX
VHTVDILKGCDNWVAEVACMARRVSRNGEMPDTYEGQLAAALSLLEQRPAHFSPLRQDLVQIYIVTDIAVSRELLTHRKYMEVVESSTRYLTDGKTQREKDQNRRSLPLSTETRLVCSASLEHWAHIYLSRTSKRCDVGMRQLMESLNVEMLQPGKFPVLWPAMLVAKRDPYGYYRSQSIAGPSGAGTEKGSPCM